MRSPERSSKDVIPSLPLPEMSYSLNSLKGIIQGLYRELYRGDQGEYYEFRQSLKSSYVLSSHVHLLLWYRFRDAGCIGALALFADPCKKEAQSTSQILTVDATDPA